MNVSRRRVIMGIMAALTAPSEVRAQPGTRVQRVAIYSGRAGRDALVEALRERGWVEGSNIAFEWHGAEGSESGIAEHLRSNPTDVLVCGGPHRLRAAMRATTTISIVAVDLESDPMASGFVRTLARPGENVTGIWMDLPEIAGKSGPRTPHHRGGHVPRHGHALLAGAGRGATETMKDRATG